jgi:hypothetical protein
MLVGIGLCVHRYVRARSWLIQSDLRTEVTQRTFGEVRTLCV